MAFGAEPRLSDRAPTYFSITRSVSRIASTAPYDYFGHRKIVLTAICNERLAQIGLLIHHALLQASLLGGYPALARRVDFGRSKR